MPSAVRLPQTASPLNVVVVARETHRQAALPAVTDIASPTGGEGASNPTKFSNCHDEPASASTASGLASVAPWTPPILVNTITALFQGPSTQPTKKCSCKRLSNDKKIDPALAALEGMRTVRTLLLAALKPVATSSNLVMDLMVDCLSFLVENIKSYASALELACTNASAKGAPTKLIKS